MLATCGLDQFGSPTQDGGTEFGLHGRISNHQPATQVNYRTYWDGNDYKLEITGEIRQAALFCENLVLRRRITTALGSNQIRIEDSVTNEGFEPVPHMLLYHFNLGFPLVSEYTRLQLQSEETLARDATAQTGLVDWDRFQAPTHGYQEQVFIHRPVADENGLTLIELHNPQIGYGLRWTYKTAELPYLMEWKMMGEGAQCSSRSVEQNSQVVSVGRWFVIQARIDRSHKITLRMVDYPESDFLLFPGIFHPILII